VRGADLFVGLSVPGVLSVEHLQSMNENPIVFAMANPDPEKTRGSLWAREDHGHGKE
jgi:malic enzyme